MIDYWFISPLPHILNPIPGSSIRLVTPEFKHDGSASLRLLYSPLGGLFSVKFYYMLYFKLLYNDGPKP